VRGQLIALGALATVLTVAPPSCSTAGPPFVDVRAPLLLRLEGIVTSSHEAARRVGFAATSLELLDTATRRWIGVSDVRTLGGDQFLMGKDVLAALAPFDPNLLVAGPPDLAMHLGEAPIGSRVTIEGIVIRSSRVFYLRRLDIQPAG
jgi:hypothetical protein